MIVVPQNVVVRGATGALDALMAAQIEIKFGGMCDAHIDGGACGNIARFAALLLLLRAEESSMMALLHHNECDARPILWL